MKILLKILFYIFIGSMIVGLYLQYIDHPLHRKVIGIDILFLVLILMPLFIYHRFKKGKYKKYVIDPNSKNPFKINQKDL